MSRNTTKTPIVVAYVREANGFALDGQQQAHAIRSHLQKIGFNDKIVFHVEEADSGRVHYEKFLTLLHSEECQVAVCYSADRLDDVFDDLAEAVRFLADLEKHNVRFIAIQDGLDTFDFQNPFQTVVRIVSESKSVLKSERTKAGLHEARKTGKTVGRPSTKHDKDVLELRRAGTPIRSIAQQLGISTSTVQAVLHRAHLDSH